MTTQRGSRSWRSVIAAANEAVERAYGDRRRVFQDAHAAGFSFRQIAEAAGTSASNVHKIVGTGTTTRVSLDDEAEGYEALDGQAKTGVPGGLFCG